MDDRHAIVPLATINDPEEYARQIELHLMEMWEMVGDWKAAGGRSRSDVRHPGVGMVARLTSHIGFMLREAADRAERLADERMNADAEQLALEEQMRRIRSRSRDLT